MTQNQKNIYSLLDPIKSELIEDDQRQESNTDSEKASPEIRKGESTEYYIAEGGILEGSDEDLENEKADSEGTSSSDFIDKDICPRCEKIKLVRIRRHWWMRLFPQSSHYRCLACHARFLVVWRLEMKLPKKKS